MHEHFCQVIDHYWFVSKKYRIYFLRLPKPLTNLKPHIGFNAKYWFIKLNFLKQEHNYCFRNFKISDLILTLNLRNTKDISLIKEWVSSNLKIPDISGIWIESISEADANLAKFLSNCTPAHLRHLVINQKTNSFTGIKSKFYIDAFSKAATNIAKEVFFYCIYFRAKDLQTVVRSAHKAERIVFNFCDIHCSSSLDFGANLSYNTKFLSFQFWGSTIRKERMTDWKTDSSKFSIIVDAIGNSGLSSSLEQLIIFGNPTLSNFEVQLELNLKKMSHISVVEEPLFPLSS